MSAFQNIETGDARALIDEIPDESIDLILTDPVYDDLAAYSWLARMANRVLKPNAACLVFCAIGNIPETHQALGEFLTYRWRLVIRPVNSKEFFGRLMICSQEILWYEKGRSKLYESLFDVQLSTSKGHYGVSGANWGKGADAIARLIVAFTRPGDTVLDPFAGSGTVPVICKILERNCIAFEVEPEIAERARKRLEEQQSPLPLFADKQLELF